MMNHIILSMRTRHASDFRAGHKTADIRSKPLPVPCRIFLYEGMPTGKIIGEVLCFEVGTVAEMDLIGGADLSLRSVLQLTDREIREYLKPSGYIHPLENLMIYNPPRELADFGLDRPPRSWQYIRPERIPEDLRGRTLMSPPAACLPAAERTAEESQSTRTASQPYSPVEAIFRDRARQDKAKREQRQLTTFTEGL